MKIEAEILRDVVTRLFAESRQERRGRSTAGARLLSLVTKHRVLEDQAALESAFREDHAETIAAVPLPVLHGEKLMLPLLWFAFDFRGGREELALRVALFSQLREGEGLASIGYRLETSEGPGAHDFCHLQPIRYVRLGEGEPIQWNQLHWVDAKVPTVPVPADSPIELIGVMVAMLYGFVKLGAMAQGAAVVRPHWRRLSERLDGRSTWRYHRLSRDGEDLFVATRARKEDEIRKAVRDVVGPAWAQARIQGCDREAAKSFIKVLVRGDPA